ncbi:bifunctional proline dehydrogenase/L-glutamate gamma-semialdehyde dehydrogenase [Gordonia sp. (in: high G+C Gram-positive bacteria)]|uniref:bifunctional proline dehydrogenase/L-glutamate gamma-semialdehyde dehydrogenase n=1 Tax=Gordonia sp. (in: high G+C Gram-positive bacteria) TaxID=84139 RepID=UPI0016BBF4ED|nr:bifunctional proline dehydrogenase/L-glutamate gamma-semialdehyde dehydrogenase [Gordonia sp. (in: high G+C Gram-positive bacteria)]NLG46997.1 bifunctional proline dehydrogenase/L-glutamate gamma-semialdehyde dehydrogenase [Gordonia sp. (in: high G+C Gram-positive bacteria)]
MTTAHAINPTAAVAELDQLARAAETLVTRWLREAAAAETRPHASAQRLAAMLSDPRGLDFTVGFVDRVIGTEDTRAAAEALSEIAADIPATLGRLDRAQIAAGGALAEKLPNVVIPTARARMRAMVGHMIVDARDRQFSKAVAKLRESGHRLNINPLGEAVLGDGEADNHLADARALLRRDDVDYVSIKVSSVASQISMWAFDETVQYVLDRLTPMYLEAAAAPAGTKFINLDMEEYRDLELTIEVFTRLLSLPELKHFEAGIVLQAYLPDALGAMQRLATFAEHRVADGGAGIKVRLVKGANLAMETVHAEVAGWPKVTCSSKTATDANYKLVLHWLLDRENMRGLRVGVAGHNLFDIAFAHLLSQSRGVSDRVEFEMLQGMATEQAEVLSADVGRLLLYVPTVKPKEFDVAISYLVRRLEENAASENFMSGIFELAPGSAMYRREAGRFRDAVNELARILTADGHEAPRPNDHQNRALEADRTGFDASLPLPAFTNEPDTNAALPANQEWARAAIATATPEWLAEQSVPAGLAEADVDELVARARAGAAAWSARPASERAAILYRTADILASRRGHLVSIAAAEAGKAVAQSDPEISEAIDFARYYAHRALELDDVNAEFTPDRVVVVTPPWNFPIAIPAGGTFAALAVGAAVIHKPAKPTPRCSMAVLEALWEAGVPRDVCQGVFPDEGPAGRALISHPDVDRVILTGASETAALFTSWRRELRINAETSGKNSLIITPSADRDLAIADLVHSAFGHAGQKCSAASLGILVGSTYDSDRFRRQLVDAASSAVVDWPSNLSATVGPLTEDPGDKLRRALTTLEPGERWLLKPEQLDDTGRLWSPGIKDGVAPGSFFHLTECFGPVLGLMRAETLDEAIELQNATEFGLTAGLHSLEPREVRRWLDRVEAGNAYVNRGITGAIVRRQPFGGWKRSSVGLGSKAGGPNYLMLFGEWNDRPHTTGDVAAPTMPAVAAFADAVDDVVDADASAWLRRALADDDRAWASEFGVAHDETGLASEANIFRYRPAAVAVRVTADSSPVRVARLLAAAHRSGSRALVVPEPGISAALATVLDAARRLNVDIGAPADDAALVTRLSTRDIARVRMASAAGDGLRDLLAHRPEVALLDDAVTASGRVELRYWLLEQAVSMTLHRFGNPDRAFGELVADLMQAEHATPRPPQA